MTVLTFDRVGELLDEMADAFPQALFRNLNGGVNLLPDEVQDPDFPEGEIYVMGEYCDDALGRYVNLYYGSFAALARNEDWTEADWTAELRTTLSHELTHHLEALGGVHGLNDRDAAELEEFRREYGVDE